MLRCVCRRGAPRKRPLSNCAQSDGKRAQRDKWYRRTSQTSALNNKNTRNNRLTAFLSTHFCAQTMILLGALFGVAAAVITGRTLDIGDYKTCVVLLHPEGAVKCWGECSPRATMTVRNVALLANTISLAHQRFRR